MFCSLRVMTTSSAVACRRRAQRSENPRRHRRKNVCKSKAKSDEKWIGANRRTRKLVKKSEKCPQDERKIEPKGTSGCPKITARALAGVGCIFSGCPGDKNGCEGQLALRPVDEASRNSPGNCLIFEWINTERFINHSRRLEVIGREVQKLQTPTADTLIGSGKVQLIALRVRKLGVQTVVFDEELGPAQRSKPFL